MISKEEVNIVKDYEATIDEELKQNWTGEFDVTISITDSESQPVSLFMLKKLAKLYKQMGWDVDYVKDEDTSDLIFKAEIIE